MKATAGAEVISLCRLAADDDVADDQTHPELFALRPLNKDGFLTSQDQTFAVRFLIDTGCNGYAFIHEDLVEEVCHQLHIEPVAIPKPKRVRGWDGQISKKLIRFAIYPSFTLGGYRQATMPMLIANLGHNQAILGKPWMNQCGPILDMKDDTIIFPDGSRADNAPAIPSSTQLKLPPPEPPPASQKPILKNPQILPRQKPSCDVDNSSTIFSVGAAPFNTLANQQENNIFAMSMEDIDLQLAFEKDCQVEEISLNAMGASETNLAEIKAKLPPEYHEYLDVFDRTQANQLPPHRPSDHRIELIGDTGPPRTRAYRMNPFKLQKVKEYLAENLSKGFITPSQAPYSSPVLFAQKPNGDLRFCVDYRKLNAMTKRNGYTLPLMEEVLGQMNGCKHLTRLDIIAAFNKLRMHPDSEDYTTFITALGAYKYKVLPFGLTNGPASFQQYINDTLFDFLHKFCQAYLDDVLIYSKTKKEHRKHVCLVLERLRSAGLQVDIKKCEFDVEETMFLGVLVSGQGLRMDPEKVKVVVEWRTPKHLKEVQGFLGFANFYRRFIKDYSKTVRALNNLTKKDHPFVWNEACELAFQGLKDKIVSAPVLRHFDHSRQAILETDSSDWVTGGVLSQYDDDGVLHPVAFFSKSLDVHEVNYHIYDKELLAIVRCLEHWSPELTNTLIPIQIFTDHQALKTFMEHKVLTRRQSRYLDILSEFNFKIIFRAGKGNAKADALTRLPGYKPDNVEDERIKQQAQVILTPDRIQVIAGDLVEDSIFLRVMEANKTDARCSEIREALAHNKKRFDGIHLSYCRNLDGILFKRGLLWVPESLQVELLQEVHDQPSSGHPGVSRTVELLKRHYYWPRFTETVKQYIRNCYPCKRSKTSRETKKGLLVPLSIPQRRWQDISMDFITGLPVSEKYNAICTIVDRLSKERHYVPCWSGDEGLSAEEVMWILIWNVYRLHGLPDTIISDRGSQFVSTVWKQMCKRLGIKASLSTAYHPETDGQTERANQDVERTLRTYCNYMQDDWAKWIPMAEFSDNNNISASTTVTPFYLNKGFNPRMSFSPDTSTYETTRERLQAMTANDIADRMQEILEYARANLDRSQERMRKQADKSRKYIEFQEGQEVWLDSGDIHTERPSQKLEDKRLGPYKIIKKAGASYELALPKSMRVHPVFSTEKLYRNATDPLPGQKQEPPKPVVVDGKDTYEVDDILDSRIYYGRLQYKVKWSGVDRDDHWYYTDRDEFGASQEVVDEFHRRYPKKPGPKDISAPKKRGRKPGKATDVTNKGNNAKS